MATGRKPDTAFGMPRNGERRYHRGLTAVSRRQHLIRSAAVFATLALVPSFAQAAAAAPMPQGVAIASDATTGNAPAAGDPDALAVTPIDRKQGDRQRLAQSTDLPKATLSVSKVILVEPASTTPLPIVIGPPSAIPANAFLRLRGLPPVASLSHGHVISPGAWAVPLFALRDLKLSIPAGASGRSRLSIALATLDGNVAAESESLLIIGPAGLVAPPATAKKQQPPREPEQASPSRAVTPPAPRAAETTSATARIVSPPAEQPKQRIERAAPPPRSAPAPAPEPARLSEADRQRAERLYDRGNTMLTQGDIASARLFLRRAADMGLAKAALLLGGTYDPNMIATFAVVGLAPDKDEAAKWYDQARKLGSNEAGRRLTRLEQAR